MNVESIESTGKEETVMAGARRVEIFSAGCPVCEDAIVFIKRIAGPSCEVKILDMHQADVARRAIRYGIRSVPAVVVDGKLAGCTGRGPDEAALRVAVSGQATAHPAGVD